jgi:hypothetical protein
MWRTWDIIVHGTAISLIRLPLTVYDEAPTLLTSVGNAASSWGKDHLEAQQRPDWRRGRNPTLRRLYRAMVARPTHRPSCGGAMLRRVVTSMGEQVHYVSCTDALTHHVRRPLMREQERATWLR